MAKTRVEKEEALALLGNRIEQMKSAVIIDYRGLKVKETEELRRSLRENKVDMHVAKVSLAKIAMKKHGIEIDDSIYEKPIAIAFGMEDEVSAAKQINDFAKKKDVLEILGGIFENKFISTDKVKQLALLPSKDQLRARVVGTLAAPLSGMVNVLAGNIRGLVNVLNAYRGTKSS